MITREEFERRRAALRRAEIDAKLAALRSAPAQSEAEAPVATPPQERPKGSWIEAGLSMAGLTPEVRSAVVGAGKSFAQNVAFPVAMAAGGSDPVTERVMRQAQTGRTEPVRPTVEAQKAVVAKGMEVLEPKNEHEKFGYYTETGVELAAIPVAVFQGIRAAYTGAKAAKKIAEALTEEFAKKGVTLTEDQIKVLRAGGKPKLTADQVKAATAQATPPAAAVPDAVAPVTPAPEAPPVAAAAPPASAPAAPAPPTLSPKAKGLQTNIDRTIQQIEELKAAGADPRKIRGKEAWLKKQTKDLNAEIKATNKYAKLKATLDAKKAKRDIPALAGTPDAETSPEILFSEQVKRAPGLFRTEAQKIAIATGKQKEIITANDIKRMEALGHKPTGRVVFGQLAKPAPNAMKDTGPVGAFAERILREKATVSEMRIDAVKRWLKKSFKGWSQEQKDIVIDFLDGKITPEQMAKMTPEIRHRIEEARRIFSDADREAMTLGMTKKVKSGEKIPYVGRRNYFPHYDTMDIGEVEKILKTTGSPLLPDQKSRLLKGVDVDEVLNPEQASALRKSPFQPARTPVGTTSGSIMFERDFDGPFNRNLEEVVLRYVDRTYRQFEEVKNFGPDVKKGIDALVSAAEKNGEDGAFIRDALQASLGGGKTAHPKLEEIANSLIELESVARLPFASVGQLNQIVNPVVKGGFANTAKTAVRMLIDLAKSKDGELIAAARRGAVTFESVQDDLLGKHGGSGMSTIAEGQLKGTAFIMEDTAWRYLSGGVGTPYADDLLKAALGKPPSWIARATGDFRNARVIRERALRELAEGDVDVDTALKTGKFTEMDRALYARHFSETVQFPLRKGSAPYLFENSPFSRVLFLFKKWNSNQLDLFMREVVKPLKDHDARPLARWLVATPIVGEFANQIMDVVMNRDRSEQDVAARVAQAYVAGSFGFLGQAINTVFPLDGVMKVTELAPTARTVGEFGKLYLRTGADVYGATKEAIGEGSTQPLENMAEDWGDELAQFPEGEGRAWDYAAGVSRHAKAVRNYIRDDGEDHVIFKKLKGQL